MSEDLTNNRRLWQIEELRNIQVGEERSYIPGLSKIFVNDANYEAKFLELGARLKLSASDNAQLPGLKRAFSILESKTPFDGYVELLQKWKSGKGREATFGVLIDALTEVNWVDPIDEILSVRWENVPVVNRPSPTQNVPLQGNILPMDQRTESGHLISMNEDVVDGIDWVDGKPLVIDVMSSIDIHEGPGCYKMTSTPRGLVLIINNEFKGNPNRQRNGSTLDVAYVNRLFQKMKFQVFGAFNLKSGEFKTVLVDFKKLITMETQSIIIIIMTHGQLGFIEMEDGVKMDIYTEFVDQFNHANCPLMENKPKLFFFQACQNIPKREEKDISDNLLTGDILMGFPSLSGKYAYRNPDLGSRYIYTLIKVLMENAYKHHLLYMLETLVVEEMNNMKLPNGAERQVAHAFTIGPFNKFYFNP